MLQFRGEPCMPLRFPGIPVICVGRDGGQGWRRGSWLRGRCADNAQGMHYAGLGCGLHVHQVFQFFVVARVGRVRRAGQPVTAVFHEVRFVIAVSVLLLAVQGRFVLVLLKQFAYGQLLPDTLHQIVRLCGEFGKY